MTSITPSTEPRERRYAKPFQAKTEQLLEAYEVERLQHGYFCVEVPYLAARLRLHNLHNDDLTTRDSKQAWRSISLCLQKLLANSHLNPSNAPLHFLFSIAPGTASNSLYTDNGTSAICQPQTSHQKKKEKKKSTHEATTTFTHMWSALPRRSRMERAKEGASRKHHSEAAVFVHQPTPARA